MLGVNNYYSNDIAVQNYSKNSTVQNPSFKRYDGYSYSSSSKTKKLAVGASSLLLPGLGQVINGETAKGVAIFLASVCNCLFFFKIKNNRLAGTVGGVGISGYAAYDAYKNA